MNNEANKIVKMVLAETRVSLEQLGEMYGVTKQCMSQKLKKELPEEVQQAYCQAIIALARERIRNVERMVDA